EYKDVLMVVGQCRYRKALDHLECLCVQHLLELTKLGMSDVNKIGKALKTCAEAIQHALEAYNTTANQLNPPCEHLTWAKLM
ncbi:hypothetical protein L208DRAFT_1213777, partial [Tricholoma matsutake]